ncbi:hypothetical protein GQ600_26571 [Phytophthora cactorum]|nr:hypothetical protein GQ600_26571 [Phytophthora cactorum]
MAPLTSARPCSAIGCNKRAQTRRLCKAHGGGVRCRISDCKKLAQTEGCVSPTVVDVAALTKDA